MVIGTTEAYKNIQLHFREWLGLSLVLIAIALTAAPFSGGMVFNGLFFVFLAVLAVLDYHYMLLYNLLTYSMALYGLAYSAVLGLYYLSLSIFATHLLGGLVYGGIFFILWRFVGGMGGGDMKFAIAIGIWLGLPNAVLAMLLSFIAGGIGATVLLLRGAKGGTRMAFGPYMALGAYVACCFGINIIEWYFGI